MAFMPNQMPMPPGLPSPSVPPWAMSMAGGDTAALIKKILEQRQTPTIQPPNMPSLNPQLPQPQVYDVRPTAQGQRQSFLDKLGGRGNVGSFLQNTGMAMMAQSDTPGSSFLGNLGRALPVGIQAVDARKQDEAVNEALEGMDLPPQMRALLGALPAAQRVGVMLDMMRQPAEQDFEYRDMANGQIGVFQGGELVRTVGPEEAPDEALAGFKEYLDLPPELQAAYRGYKGAGAMRITFDQREREGLTDIDLKQYDQLVEEANVADDQMNSLSVIASMLDAGAATGRGEELLLPLRELGASLGLPTEGLGEQQVLRAISNQLTAEKTKLLQGQISEKEIALIQQTVPSLGLTPEGNRALVEILRKLAGRKVELLELADSYLDEHGSLRGWIGFRRKWLNDNPLFGAGGW